jgi:hypothetical protein
MRISNVLRWAASSLSGHVVMFAVMFSLPICATFLDLNYRDGTLSVAWALWIVSVSSLSGILVALLFWYTVSRPLLKGKKDQ